MSNYVSEAKTEMWKLYGGYKAMTKDMEMDAVPYHKFTLDIYREIKKRYKIQKES